MFTIKFLLLNGYFYFYFYRTINITAEKNCTHLRPLFKRCISTLQLMTYEETIKLKALSTNTRPFHSRGVNPLNYGINILWNSILLDLPWIVKNNALALAMLIQNIIIIIIIIIIIYIYIYNVHTSSTMIALLLVWKHHHIATTMYLSSATDGEVREYQRLMYYPVILLENITTQRSLFGPSITRYPQSPLKP